MGSLGDKQTLLIDDVLLVADQKIVHTHLSRALIDRGGLETDRQRDPRTPNPFSANHYPKTIKGQRIPKIIFSEGILRLLDLIYMEEPFPKILDLYFKIKRVKRVGVGWADKRVG